MHHDGLGTVGTVTYMLRTYGAAVEMKRIMIAFWPSIYLRGIHVSKRFALYSNLTNVEVVYITKKCTTWDT